MRTLLLVVAALGWLGCGDSTGGGDGGAGAEGARCLAEMPGSCAGGLVCCSPCRGIPYPPDFGPIYGNCASSCSPRVCG